MRTFVLPAASVNLASKPTFAALCPDGPAGEHDATAPLPSFAGFSSLRRSFPKPASGGIVQHDLACQGQFIGAHSSEEVGP